MTDIGAVAALVAGVLALLSPCSALLLPSFFAYAFGSRTALVARTTVFTVGLMLTLVPLGTGAQLTSRLFYGQRDLLIALAGWFIIALGMLQLLGGSFGLPFVGRLQGWAARRQHPGAPDGSDSRRRHGNLGSWVGTLVLGSAYGLAGFCSGPALGAILTVAATSATPWHGAGLLALYALGMAVPLFVLALAWDHYDLGRRAWLRGRQWRVGRLRLHSTSVLAGVLFIVVGAVFLRYDGTAGIVGATGIDTTDLEFAAQQSVKEWLGGVPAWVLPLAVAAVAGFVAWRRGGIGKSASETRRGSPDTSPG